MDSVEWGEWSDLGDGETEHRYIDAITINGVRWVGDGGDMRAGGLTAHNAGRGEMRDARGTVVVSALDGQDTGERDAENACEAAIRVFSEDAH